MERPIHMAFKVIKHDLMNSMWVLMLMVHCLVIGVLANDNVPASESLTTTLPRSSVLKVNEITEEQSRYFQNLIFILKELQYFNIDGNKSDCFALKEIENVVKTTGSNSKQIGIHFYFDEINIPDQSSVMIAQGAKDSNLNNNANVKYIGGDCNTLPPSFQDRPGLPGLDKMSRKQVDGTETDDNTDNTTKDNKTATLAVIPQNVANDDSEDDKQKGLSRTQVIVIATCSAVIGTFFIIAGAMRIHSCLKRYRENRDNILGLGRRARGFADTSSIRRESGASKTSRQSQPASKAGSDSHLNRNGRTPPSLNHNTPQHCSDHKQLLPGHNQLLPGHPVGQGSEENSSHGSLAYIDEETFSKAKQTSRHNSGSECGSEDYPLLRKSPDSGSSLDVTLENDDDEEKNECAASQYTGVTSCDGGVTSCERTSSSSKLDDITTPARMDTFDPSSELGSSGSVNEPSINKDNKVCVVDKQLVESDRPLEPPIGKNGDLVKLNIECVRGAIDNTNIENSTPIDISEAKQKAGHFSNDRKSSIVSDSGKIIPTKNRKLPKTQFSVDYFETDDYGVEISNPIFEEGFDESTLSENLAVTVGLTQSDSSLSNNPSYAYGNQTGYEVDPGYGHYGYCNPCMYGPDLNFYLNGPDSIRNTLRNSVLLSAENLRRANDGDILTMADSFEEPYANDAFRRRESLIDDFGRSKVSRMLSTDSYFTHAKRPLKAENSSPSPVEGTSDSQNPAASTKLKIVPLSEYHRNSLKESVDDENEENS